jgi:hypothetical protein
MKICKSMLLISDPTIDLDRFSSRPIKPLVLSIPSRNYNFASLTLGFCSPDKKVILSRDQNL